MLLTPVWSGVGVVLITFIGAFYFHEQLTISRLVFIAMIVVGVVGLQVSSDASKPYQNKTENKVSGVDSVDSAK